MTTNEGILIFIFIVLAWRAIVALNDDEHW